MARSHMFILCIYIKFSILLCAFAYESTNDNNNKIDYVLPAYTIASTTSDILNSTLCKKEMLTFRDAVDQRILWSLKMLDSSGKLQPGFFYGNNYWLGSRIQCMDTMNTSPLQISQKLLLNNSLYRDPQKETPPFKINYFVAYFKHNNTLQYHINLPNEDIITLGLCLPASCSKNDISFILKKLLHEKSFPVNNLYSMNFELVDVKDLKHDYKWLISGATSFLCVILLLLVFMVITGTIYDIFVTQKYVNTKNKVHSSFTKGKNTIQIVEAEADSLHKDKIGKMLMCFSAYTNTKVIFKTKLNADSLPIVHGLKFFSMCWIIVGHVSMYSYDYMDNKIWALRNTNGIFNQLISSSQMAVDTFFFLSGFLVSYCYIKDKMDKNRTQSLTYKAQINEFFVLIIKRFLRFTPTYIVVIAISQLMSTWFDKTSPFYLHERPHETCSKYWWRNLLYINNLFSFKTMCMSWSWYISADMQFFVISIALLILSTTHFYVAAVLLCLLLIGSITFAGYISYIYEFVPTLEEQYRLVDVLYLPSWIRINPYIIGIITGYILIRLNGKLELKRRTVILCWCLGSACNIIVIYSLYDRHIPVLFSAIYTALHRSMWAIGIAWVVIACLTQHGGIIYNFLSFKFWIPLSRLSYCVYLLNPIIINLFNLLSDTSVHFEFISLIIIILGYLMIIYFFSYILSLIVETPCILLMKTIMQARSKRNYKWRNNTNL